MRTRQFAKLCFLFPTTIILLFGSCSTYRTFNKVTLVKGMRLTQLQVIAATDNDGNPATRPDGSLYENYNLNTYKLASKADATIKIEESQIRVTLLRTLDSKTELIDPVPITAPDEQSLLGAETETSYRIPTKFEYPNGILATRISQSGLLYNPVKTIVQPYILTSKFKYNSTSWISQAITVPIKIRPGVDTLNYEVTTGVNVGFAFGRKWTRHTLQPIYNSSTSKMIGYDATTKSIGITGFVGPTTVKLTTVNTKEAVTADRTILGINFGLATIFELNKFNAGLAIGWDTGIGKEAKDWIYDWKPWYGVVIGFDIIK